MNANRSILLFITIRVKRVLYLMAHNLRLLRNCSPLRLTCSNSDNNTDESLEPIYGQELLLGRTTGRPRNLERSNAIRAPELFPI